MLTGRKVYIDALRIFAIFCVVFNHTGAFSLYQTQPEYIVFSILCKTAVPIFLLISGALLIDKKESIKDLFKKRIIKFGITLIGISIIAYFYNCRKYSGGIFEGTVLEFLKQFLSCSIDASYWYLYMYISILCCLPLLRIWVNGMSDDIYWYFTGFVVILQGVYPMLKVLYAPDLFVTPHLAFPTMDVNIWLILTGYYLEKNSKQFSCKKAIVIFSLFFLLSIISAVISGMSTDLSFYFVALYSFVLAPCIYIIFKYFFENHVVNSTVTQKISYVGNCTFGIYLFQYLFLRTTDYFCWLLAETTGIFLACVIQMGVVILLGFLLTSILKKIPCVRNFL